MTDDRYFYPDLPEETAILVGIEFKSDPGSFDVLDSLAELEQLAGTAGVRVVGETFQRISTPNSATLIGTGKLAEVLDLLAENTRP